VQLSTIFARFFRRTETHAPVLHSQFSPVGLELPDHPETLAIGNSNVQLPQDENRFQSAFHSLRVLGEDLHGVTFGIEYQDAAGAVTSRRVSIRQICASDDGRIYINALCYERRAFRSFRLDRIRAIIDFDGVVWPPPEFFKTELHVDLTRWEDWPVKSGALKSKSQASDGLTHQQIAGDEIRVLTALGRKDGFLAESEIAVIVDFAMNKAAKVGVATNDADRKRLRATLRRQRPGAAAVEECLARIEREPIEDQKQFVEAAIAVMDADGVQDAQEFDMVMRLLDHLNNAKTVRT